MTVQQRTAVSLQEQQVSAANKRLALQMENRPAVQAALNPQHVRQQQHQQQQQQPQVGEKT